MKLEIPDLPVRVWNTPSLIMLRGSQNCLHSHPNPELLDSSSALLLNFEEEQFSRPLNALQQILSVTVFRETEALEWDPAVRTPRDRKIIFGKGGVLTSVTSMALTY